MNSTVFPNGFLWGAASSSAQIEGAWNEDFLDEVCGFPTAPHDEYVDILGYAINDLYEDDDDFDYDSFSWR